MGLRSPSCVLINKYTIYHVYNWSIGRCKNETNVNDFNLTNSQI